MQRQGFSTKNIEYFERDFLDQLGSINSSTMKITSLGRIQLFHVKGLPKFWEERGGDSGSIQIFMEDLVAGLNESRVPVLFSVFGDKGGLEIVFGTFTDDGHSLEKNSEILVTCLKSSFHGLDLEVLNGGYLHSKLDKVKFSGVLTGVPSETIDKGRLKTADIDRLMRGISGRNCGFIVVGIPLENERINSLFSMILNEIRIILESERHIGQENPTVRHYKAILEKYLEKLQIAKSQGLWASSFFMYGDKAETLDQLKALTKSAFSGRNSVPDRIRTLQINDGKVTPGFILNPAPVSPGQFEWPYMYSTIMGSADLASLVKFPSYELPGFRIKPYVRFNVSQDTESGVEIGEILDQGASLGTFYKIPLKGLKKHGLIVGGTGSGKTNTLFYMLKDLMTKDLPFLVIEPAKTEYRKLLFDKMFRDSLQVFTLGDNNVSPFRLNPFTVQEGVPVQTHLDLLKSVFNASFYMWGPLPHVLERCLYEIYRDKGWDLTSNVNTRGIRNNAFPTLTDLYNKVDDVVDKLGYSSETTMELKSSLKTRLNSLRIGGKGLMLDTKSSINFEKLLGKPTVLELETLGDDEEKAFMMGLVLTMMYEYYVSKGFDEEKGLSHVTVIEEAHRLLGNTNKTEAYTGDMKGKAVETFTNILSEIRAYGEGFIIAEQIPTKLSTDVVKNTNLKVMHRIVADDDRTIMASSMNIKKSDASIVSTLSVGEAVVFSEGDDGAYYIKVPYAKLGEVEGQDEVSLIMDKMNAYIGDPEYVSPYESCSNYCTNVCKYKDIGRGVQSSERFHTVYPRLVLSLLEGVGFNDSLVQMFEAGNDEARISGDALGVKICAAVQGAENFFEGLGRRYHWSYDEQEKLLSHFQDVYVDSLTKYIEQGAVILHEEQVNEFIESYRHLVKDLQPTTLCQDICSDGTCQYRYLLKDALEDEYHHDNFVETVNRGGPDLWQNLDSLCIQVANELNPYLSYTSLRKVSRCFALQKSYEMNSFSQSHIEQIMNNLIKTIAEKEDTGEVST